eukprot:6808760-Alexandrium_andersonii.AAC.1
MQVDPEAASEKLQQVRNAAENLKNLVGGAEDNESTLGQVKSALSALLSALGSTDAARSSAATRSRSSRRVRPRRSRSASRSPRRPAWESEEEHAVDSEDR